MAVSYTRRQLMRDLRRYAGNVMHILEHEGVFEGRADAFLEGSYKGLVERTPPRLPADMSSVDAARRQGISIAECEADVDIVVVAEKINHDSLSELNGHCFLKDGMRRAVMQKNDGILFDLRLFDPERLKKSTTSFYFEDGGEQLSMAPNLYYAFKHPLILFTNAPFGRDGRNQLRSLAAGASGDIERFCNEKRIALTYGYD